MKHLSTIFAAALMAAAPALAQDSLAAPDTFANITDESARSAAMFTEIGKVLTHPRCLNCHPVTGGPTQGDDMHPHDPPVVRRAISSAPVVKPIRVNAPNSVFALGNVFSSNKS